MAEKKRDAGDKAKGFILQKQRAIFKIFEALNANPSAQIISAIEYAGDVFLFDGKVYSIEENKNYDSKNFSFASSPVLNTMVYFIDYWLKNDKSNNIVFTFYATNEFVSERSSDKTKELTITLPGKGILDSLSQKKLDTVNLIDACKKFIIDEYKDQYKSQSDKNNLKKVEALSDDEWKQYFNQIDWNFSQPNEKELDDIITKQIQAYPLVVKLNIQNKAAWVRAFLKEEFEFKQTETDPTIRFINKDKVENIIYKVNTNDIPSEIYRHLDFNFSELIQNTKIQLLNLLKGKYHSTIIDKAFPKLINRKLAKHSREVKIDRKQLEQTDPQKVKQVEAVVKELGDLINSNNPTFIFGEIGSGKSTLLAHYFLESLDQSSEIPIFIPSSFLKGKVPVEISALKEIINGFVNNELNLNEKFFDLKSVLLAKKEITLIIDGLDEYDKDEARRLLQHLITLSESAINLRVIASGRPIELQDIVVFNEWNCLTTLDLTEEEILQLLHNEAIGAGLDETEAVGDSEKRLKILKSKQELFSTCTTPLIVCLVRDYLDEQITSKTLGDLLYDILRKRLDWHKTDQKENLKSFLDAYPNPLQREAFIAEIAANIYNSSDRKLSEDTLFQIINSYSLISQGISNRNTIVDEAIKFFKANFLQQIGNSYAFGSHQLYQVALGLYIYNQIVLDKEFVFKDQRINEWREISYAGTVARKKGGNTKMESFFSGILNDLLFTSDNTPATAVLLSEVQISALNRIFLEKIKVLNFRPLKFWGSSDSLAPNAYAYILTDIGKEGFEWLFDEYINPKHPTATSHDELGALILKYYFIRRQFQVLDYEKEKLSSVIPFHTAAITYACNTFLPILALIIPDKFNTRDKCILLAYTINNDIIANKVEQLLRSEWNNGNESEVLNGLEIACISDEYRRKNALRLWLELSEKVMPKAILDYSIIAISKGEEDIYSILTQKINSDNLRNYLKFNVLYKNDISDAAAMVLYTKYGERDIDLILAPILHKTKWLDYQSSPREKIIGDLISQNGEKGKNYILNNIPESERDMGISEVYLKFFLETIQNSNEIYLNNFLFVVKNLGKFTLSRYSEIRNYFNTILNRQEYYDGLKLSLNNLDRVLRYNSASILLICFPEKEKEALEIIIRSSYKSLSNHQEWLRFCMKLNFSIPMLDFIHSLLPDLTEIARIFAIKLLYHNHEYKLNQALLTDLVNGMLGNGKFLDWSGTLNHDNIDPIVQKEVFFEQIKTQLDSNDYALMESAASKLIHHHYSKLTIEEKAKCLLLYSQYSDFGIIDFNDKYLDLFDDLVFTNELKRFSQTTLPLLNGGQFIFYKYYQAIKENGNWIEFFLALLNKHTHSNHHKLEHIYSWIILTGRKNAETGIKIGKAMKELMSYPTVSQNTDHNFIFPRAAVIAHEFGQLNNIELEEILNKYRITQSEIACSLLYRLGKIPDTYQPDRWSIGHISLFITNKITAYKEYSIDEIKKLLIDGEEIPNELLPCIEYVLRSGIFTEQEIKDLCTQGKIATYFAIVLAFSRNIKLGLNNFIIGEEIGSYKYFARGLTQLHTGILLRIKRLLISDDNERDLYVKSLIEHIKNLEPRDSIDFFKELFELKADFDPLILSFLFESFFEVPYRLNLDFVFQICDYVANKVGKQNREELINLLKKHLKAVLNSGFEEHKNELDLLTWTLSILLLFLEKNTSDETERGFLTGLKNMFIQDSHRLYQTEENGNNKFKGKDLLMYSAPIFKQLDNALIQKIIKKGSDSNVPEINGVCKLISSLSGKH
jgi:hypothetical protein